MLLVIDFLQLADQCTTLHSVLGSSPGFTIITNYLGFYFECVDQHVDGRYELRLPMTVFLPVKNWHVKQVAIPCKKENDSSLAILSQCVPPADDYPELEKIMLGVQTAIGRIRPSSCDATDAAFSDVRCLNGLGHEKDVFVLITDPTDYMDGTLVLHQILIRPSLGSKTHQEDSVDQSYIRFPLTQIEIIWRLESMIESLTRLSVHELQWKSKWEMMAKERYPCISSVMWNNACMDVDIFIAIESHVLDPTLEPWLTNEATRHGFCYSLRKVT